MLGNVSLPTTPAPRMAHARNWACTLVGMKLINMNQQTPHKSPHEVTQIGRVLLGPAVQLGRNISESF
jgi:hypothetical protein